MAEQFYPERADFTSIRSIGTEFASHLMTGQPVLARRDLANSLSSMLRPRGQAWFHPRTQNERVNKDATARFWLDWAGDQMRKVMYDNHSGFVRATKEGDNDFATFGQGVLTLELNQDLDGLHYRCHHLRDVAWAENEHLEVDTVHHKMKLAARNIKRKFPKTCPTKITDQIAKQPLLEHEIRRIVLPSDEYDLTWKGGRNRPKFVSIYLSCEHDTILEEVHVRENPYIIPRWQTVSGSQYAYSPATVIAISDARMLQQMTLTLLEAGQKAVDPPLIAKGELINGGVNTFPGGITWVDPDYDERTGEALRQLGIGDRNNFGWANDREAKIVELIKEAFYLNMISLPDVGGEKMTAYETQKRVEEYIRRALPLFEPMEVEYNGALCDRTFELLLRYNVFGSMKDLPQALRGQDIRFVFESPIQAAANRQNSQAFAEAANLLGLAAGIDPTVRYSFSTDQAFRDAVEGTGAPANWLVPKEVADQAKQDEAEQQAAMQELQAGVGMMGQGAEVAAKIGDAAQSLQAGGVM